MVLVGAACALTLAVLVGVRAESAHAGERTKAWRAPALSVSRRSPLASPERLEQLVGVHQPSSHGQPLPHSKRFASRDGSVARLETRTVALTRTLLSCALPMYAGRIADRPLIANCPAQGPPRTA